jgi:phosphoribosylaminoimidazole-succinocarboxamide synthase
MTLLRSEIHDLPLIHRGKVRETYEVDEQRLLLVATDRLSAFDVVFDQPIPASCRRPPPARSWMVG